MLERFRLSQSESTIHMSQMGEEHIYYHESLEIKTTKEALRAFYMEMFRVDKNSVCNCDNSLDVAKEG